MAPRKKVEETVEHANIATALLAFQQEAPDLQKNAINPHFGNKYISLDSLMPQILPVLQKHGLLLIQVLDQVNALPALRTTIVHVSSGETIEGICPLQLDKQTAQGVGSAVTYYRRYAIMAALGLVADLDDDGQRASAVSVAQTAVAQPVTVGAGDSGDPFSGSGVPGGIPTL